MKSEDGIPIPENPEPHHNIRTNIEVYPATDIGRFIPPCPLCFGSSLELFQLNSFVKEAGKRLDIPFVKCRDCQCQAPMGSWSMPRPKIKEVIPGTPPTLSFRNKGHSDE